MHFLMCQEHLEAYLSDDVERMTFGLFPLRSCTCAEGAEDACDEVRLWEGGLGIRARLRAVLKAGCACGDSRAIGPSGLLGIPSPLRRPPERGERPPGSHCYAPREQEVFCDGKGRR